MREGVYAMRSCCCNNGDDEYGDDEYDDDDGDYDDGDDDM